MLKRLAFVLATTIGGVINAPVSAQEWSANDGKLRMRFEELREAGRLVGCNMFLVQVGFDNVSRQGKPVIISSVIALMLGKAKTDISILLKVWGYDPNPARANAGNEFTPTYAYISASNYSSAKQEATILPYCDGPGFCAVFNSGTAIRGFLDTMTYAGMAINLQRRSGGLDLRVPITFDGPVAPYSSTFSACAQSLVANRVP